MKIGMIGSGHIGGTLGNLLTRAGHEVAFGRRSEPGSIPRVVADGEVVIYAGYFGGWPEFARANADALAGKVVIDAANPYGERDGDTVKAVKDAGVGAGGFVAGLLPRAHVAKAFNTLYWEDLRDRSREDVGMAVSADPPASEVAAGLVRDTGYEPVVIPLARSAEQDPDGPLYGKAMSAADLRTAAGLRAAG